ARAGFLGSRRAWRAYLEVAYPGVRPAGWSQRLAHIDSQLQDPGRMAALKGMLRTSADDAGARLADVRSPVLVVMGTLDPDWADPHAEGQAVVAARPPDLGRLEMLDGAGHYPHDQLPDQVASLVLDFLRTEVVHG